MATCKECIHYDICIFHIKGNENEKCPHFKIAADVVPRRIIFDLESKLHSMLPFKTHPIPIDGKCTGNSYEMGKEHVIYDILNYLGELEKKYTVPSKDKSFTTKHMCKWVFEKKDDLEL